MSKEINPLQTTFMQRGTVRGRVVLLLRVAEVKPFCCKDLFIFEQHLSLSLFFFFFLLSLMHLRVLHILFVSTSASTKRVPMQENFNPCEGEF